MTKLERTTCACQRCRACCKTMPGMLVPGDLETILGAYGPCDQDQEVVEEWVISHFAASEGALVAGPYGLGRIPTIVAAHVGADNSRCVFLNEDDLCEIHSVAPFGCRMLDTHMEREQSDPIVKLALYRIVQDARCVATRDGEWHEDGYRIGLYGLVWEILADAKSLARPLEQRKADLAKAWESLEAQ